MFSQYSNIMVLKEDNTKTKPEAKKRGRSKAFPLTTDSDFIGGEGVGAGCHSSQE